MKIEDFTKDEIIEYLRRHCLIWRTSEKSLIRELCTARYSRVAEKCLKEMDAAMYKRKSIPFENREKWLRAIKEFDAANAEFDKNEKWHDKVMKELEEG